MDDEAIYGQVIYRLGFGDAITRDILTDYKLMVLAVDEQTIQRDMQKSLSDPENGLNLDDVGRIIGVWNGMLKRETFSNNVSGSPMKRAIAFSQNIAASKKLTEQFESVVNDYLEDNDENHFQAEVHHADGTMSALEKNRELDWLADKDLPENEARILSNVRFLTEGIDVPNLDAIIFLSPRKSQVDIVQAVGRIIRKFEGKDYGYIILPVVIPAGETPESILDNNKSYDVVWQVLNALRSVDERFEATINKLQLNKKKPENIQVIGVGSAPDDEDGNWRDGVSEPSTTYQTEFQFDWEEIEGAIYGKIVEKVGDRRYLEDWSQDVSKIAQRHISYINTLLSENAQIKAEFDKFLASLKHNINDSISETQAIEMLAQHLITKPIFDALFDEYSVVRNNPVNDAMEAIVTEFSKYGFQKEQKELEAFYESVRLRAEGIDNAEAKQKIIVTLYDKFFRTGFKSTTERLGIVFTPIEVVDFIVKSVDDVLQKYFHKNLASQGVHILDPFTGTGTFVVRTLQYLKTQMDEGQITLADITRKYTQELHANEIVLLSYYIAAINIEATFDEINGDEEGYQPFEGIVLTDTFQSTETEDTLDDDFFGGNDERLKRQQEVPITVIMGNPPYSAKQDNEDGNQERVNYPKLDLSLKNRWIETSTATNKNGLLDSYIRALRWSADRISGNGIIGFITNSSYIDGIAMDGMRKSLIEEFSDVYIINLKGQIRRRTKEQTKLEGGNIFDIMTGVAIILLVKDISKNGLGSLHYFDIGNELNKKQKLEKISEISSISNIDNFEVIIPNEKGDWINQRNSNFDDLILLGNKKSEEALFKEYTGGIKTGRDSWSVGFSKNKVLENMTKSIDYYNQNLGDIAVYDKKTIDISWTRSLKQRFERNEIQKLESNRMYIGMYRPFTKKHVYYAKAWVDMQYQMAQVLPVPTSRNLMIGISNKTEGKQFSCLINNVLPDVNLFAGGSQNLPKYLYNKIDKNSLFAEDEKISAIRPEILSNLTDLSEEDVMYYIYGVFHSKEYGQMYFDDLAKSFPRVPNLKNKTEWIRIGKELADLHLNYENQPSWSGVTVSGEESGNFKVKKMKHSKIRNEEGKSVNDLSKIIYNENITISNIPVEAYDYVVNGRPAIEWIIDQYQVKTDKKSGITDDPNEFSENPRYILDLLLSVIVVSMKTNELVAQLPKMEVEDE